MSGFLANRLSAFIPAPRCGLTHTEARSPAVEVFAGNTADPSTVGAQVEKLRDWFGLSTVVLVGDRGMLTEAALDGLYVVRTSLSEDELDAPGAVQAYKRLSTVERAFRSLKTVDRLLESIDC